MDNNVFTLGRPLSQPPLMFIKPEFDPANGNLTTQKRPLNSSSKLRFDPFSGQAGHRSRIASLATTRGVQRFSLLLAFPYCYCIYRGIFKMNAK